MHPTRREEADVLRGVALFGMCVVNLPLLAGIDPFATPSGPLDRLATATVALLFQGKFFVLFSFLFGWGFAVQRASAERAGRAFGPAYARRLAGLLAIGVVHALLVFSGDILVLYALLGAALWALRDAHPRRLLGVALVCCGLAALALATLGLLADAVPLVAGPSGGSGDTGGHVGSFADAARRRLAEWPYAFGFVLLFNGPLAFAAFCAGLAAARRDFFAADAASYRALRRHWPPLLALGLASNAVYALAADGALGDGVLALAAFSALALGAPCLSSVYLLATVELLRRRGRLRSLAGAGRLSLSAYVAQGLLAGLLFDGHGLGLRGRLGEAACLGVAVVVFALVYVPCAAWSRTRRRGPLEAMLRAATRGGASPGRSGTVSSRAATEASPSSGDEARAPGGAEGPQVGRADRPEHRSALDEHQPTIRSPR